MACFGWLMEILYEHTLCHEEFSNDSDEKFNSAIFEKKYTNEME